MVQAYAQQLLNQKESEKGSSKPDNMPDAGQRMIAATKRLVAALGRLEHNLQYIGTPKAADDSQQQLQLFSRENEALRQERANLNAAVTQLQDQYSDLHQVASTIYGKLDDSIKRLTQIIEH